MSQLDERMARTLAGLVAQELWRVGAISVNSVQPFRLASGNYSPIYIDCRKLISSVVFADLFAASARIVLQRRQVDFDLVAGGETAGIPFAAFAARAFNKPMIYVRKSLKAHGLGNRIEGVLQAGNTVLLVEDLITDAGSKLSFLEAITDSGGIVRDVLVVFDRLQGGRAALETQNVRLLALTDIEIALAEGAESAIISAHDFEAVRAYLESPIGWHKTMGLPFQEPR